MQPELTTQPTAEAYELADLVRMVHDGKIRIPHFQRGFRWEAKDVRRLFDSILKGYPIGSLLFWRRPAEQGEVQLGALRIQAPRLGDALWVIDGQQRVTSLANAFRDEGQSDQRFAMAYDLQSAELLPPDQASQTKSIPLPELFDLRRLLGWFNRHPELAELVEVANDISTRLRSFRIPAYVVEVDDQKVLQDIFDRMNNYGKRLSRAEVFSALYAPTESSTDDALTIGRIAERVNEDLDFGRIDDDTVLRVILARRGPDVAREIRTEFDHERDRRRPPEFPQENRDQAFEAGETALQNTVRFIQREVGVPHFGLLPYRYLLVVTARFLAHFPHPHTRNAALLRRWFWRAALVGPEIFRGSATGAIRALCARITPGQESQSVQDLLDAVEQGSRFSPNLARFRTNEASTRIVLCALWDLGPRSVRTGEPYDRHQLAVTLDGQDSARDVARELIRRRAVPRDRRTWAANRMFIADSSEPVDELDAYLHARQMEISASLWPAVLRSHVLDTTCIDYLAGSRVEEFLDRRQRMMQSVTDSFVERVCEWQMEDTPPLDDLDLDDDGRRDDLDEGTDAIA